MRTNLTYIQRQAATNRIRNANTKTLEFQEDHLNKRAMLALKDNKMKIHEVTVSDIHSKYRYMFDMWISRGYSATIEVEGKKKILIFNK